MSSAFSSGASAQRFLHRGRAGHAWLRLLAVSLDAIARAASAPEPGTLAAPQLNAAWARDPFTHRDPLRWARNHSGACIAWSVGPDGHDGHGSGDDVRRILDRLRGEVPHLTLRTTLLLGFPGETDADAAEAARFVKEYKLARLGAFTYSPEQGTHGWDLPNRVPADVAQARYEAVIAARDEVLRAEQRAWIGKDVEVLVDESHPDSKTVVGRPVQDAPEVDLIAVVRDSRAKVGDCIMARVEDVDRESNLVAKAASRRT